MNAGVRSDVPPATDAPVLRVRDLAIEYEVRGGTVAAVRDVSFELRRGETLAIVGESGSGKTTVAFALTGFLGRNGSIRNGSIELLGRDLAGLPERALRGIRGKQISMVYQDPGSALNPSLRIGRQLSEILTEHNDISEEQAREQCIAMLEQVHMPDPRGVMERYPHQLSGGQQQRVIIAGGLLNRPALLIMDEPTTALDVTIEATVLDLVDEIRRSFDTAVLFITHDLGVVARVADRVAVMYAGEIVEEAGVRELFATPLHPYTRALLACTPRAGMHRGTPLDAIPGVVPSPAALPGGCIFAPRCAWAASRCHSEHPRFQPVGGSDRAARCLFVDAIARGEHLPAAPAATPAVADPAAGPGHEVLTVRGLKTWYREHGRSLPDLLGFGERRYIRAVEDVGFRLRAGETLGLVGESGSGKTTTAKTILGLEPLTAGSIEFMGLDLAQPVDRRDRDTLKLLQMIFQSPDSTLNPSMTVGQTIARSIVRLAGIRGRAVRERAIALLEAVKLGERYYDRLPRQLSGGEKQRVAIARALAGNPKLIVADEPTSALDVSVQATVLNLLIDIQARNRTAFILISHDLNVVLYLADHIAVMYLGHIVEYGPRAAYLRPPHHPYTEALLAAIPVPDPGRATRSIRLAGNIPSPADPPPGCVFHTRCPRFIGDPCRTPPPVHVFDGEHVIACHHPRAYLESMSPALLHGYGS